MFEEAPLEEILNAHQFGHTGIARAAEHMGRRTSLQASTSVQNHHAIGQAPRFGQVVRDQNHGHVQALAGPRQLQVERLARGRIHR